MIGARRHSRDRVLTVSKESPEMTSPARANRPRVARIVSVILAVCALLAAVVPAAASAATPRFKITSLVSPTHLIPGDTTGIGTYVIQATNISDAVTNGRITITDTLPAGVTVHPGLSATGAFKLQISDDGGNISQADCEAGPPVSCTSDRPLPPGGTLSVFIPLDVSAGAPATVTNQAAVSGGGAPTATVSDETTVASTPPAPGFHRFSTFLGAADGTAVTQAGAHPFQYTIDFQLNNEKVPAANTPIETMKKVTVDLPPGVIVNPDATPVRCVESDLQARQCPDASVIGLVHLTSGVFGFANPRATTPLYNMVTPPGTPSNFGFDAALVPLFVHIIGGVNPDGGYSLSAGADNLLEFGNISGFAVELWGDPSAASHGYRRGQCGLNGLPYPTTCPVEPRDTPFVTMPSACSGPPATGIRMNTWQNPGATISDSAVTTDADGNPVGVSGCDQLEFAPTLQARPTTKVADSPSGLDVDLQVPQTDSLGQLATANLKKAVVTLPDGLTLNPGAANGLEACSAAQIGLKSAIGQAPVRFSADQPACPDASKLGRLQVRTPLLPDPLTGTIYLAKSHDNPFDSMLALYAVVDDPQTGILIKLAGEVHADPDSGRIRATFDENPQVPFSDFELNFKGGPHGALRTPATCGSYSTTSELTPWSGTAPVAGHDDYSISQAPDGNCATSEDQLPNAPAFDAGSVSPLAGAYTPFVLNLRREDGTQQFSSVTLSPPPGLVAKLAGVPACSDAQLARAQARTAWGTARSSRRTRPVPPTARSGPSRSAPVPARRPTTSPAKVYLAGPYKGAPLSLRSSPRRSPVPSTSGSSSPGSPSTSTRRPPGSPPPQTRSPTSSSSTATASRSTCAR